MLQPAHFAKCFLLFLFFIPFLVDAQALQKNGFHLSPSSIPTEKIFSGGPPKDGIPAIDHPIFVDVDQAHFLKKTDKVLGIYINGIAKAYPIKILNWHEIVNDQFKDQSIVVTYCPLCGTGVAFDALVSGEKLDFGVSGLLYNSDVLLYDRQTQSLWSQLLAAAVTGKYINTSLAMIPMEHTTWEHWKNKYQKTKVLSTNTGFSRDYERNPYAGYEQSRRLFFSVSHEAPSHYHPKERVIGIEVNGVHKAYPFSELSQHKDKQFTDTIAGEKVIIHWDEASQSARITDQDNQLLAATTSFWFAWFTFYPNTLVFTSSS